MLPIWRCVNSFGLGRIFKWVSYISWRLSYTNQFLELCAAG